MRYTWGRQRDRLAILRDRLAILRYSVRGLIGAEVAGDGTITGFGERSWLWGALSRASVTIGLFSVTHWG